MSCASIIDMQIRKADHSHVESIRDIEHVNYPKHLHDKNEVLNNIVLYNNDFCFIAQEKTNIVGYIIAYPSDSQRSDFHLGYIKSDVIDCMYIHDLCVCMSAKNRGIGKVLLNHLQTTAKLAGFQKIIGISVNNSIEFWEKNGFMSVSSHHYNGEIGYKIIQSIN
ncbi:MAG: GNAT family N-acetyltransferase [Alphaproteobacteria bacterium]|nr:MAG: GNAT family N-acetyltransferase [Alphaproteobacteria bacterium]TAF14808.1 MAG: GNAT family N-acetyltransferase [Alphaproteobacteria bacterium]TAF38485.1 MAG: GNAT family N-acetyltransferase [Alphaproteobacteria bacterium]